MTFTHGTVTKISALSTDALKSYRAASGTVLTGHPICLFAPYLIEPESNLTQWSQKGLIIKVHNVTWSSLLGRRWCGGMLPHDSYNLADQKIEGQTIKQDFGFQMQTRIFGIWMTMYRTDPTSVQIESVRRGIQDPIRFFYLTSTCYLRCDLFNVFRIVPKILQSNLFGSECDLLNRIEEGFNSMFSVNL